jgi:hypothetical protein
MSQDNEPKNKEQKKEEEDQGDQTVHLLSK